MKFLLLLLLSTTIFADTRIINGTPVAPGSFKEVVDLSFQGAGCSGSLVGPRVVLTAAHCATTGSEGSFTIDGTKYTAKFTTHPAYPGQDMDLSLGLLPAAIEGISPVSIAKDPTAMAEEINVLGYGCTQPGGGGGNDGILRMGATDVTGFTQYDIISKRIGGGALCFGDSGGPAYKLIDGKYYQVGVNSKGNIKDTNYNTNLAIAESKNFLQTFAADNSVDICGVNKDCSGPAPDDTFTIENDKVGSLTMKVKNAENLEWFKVLAGDLMRYFESEQPTPVLD